MKSIAEFRDIHKGKDIWVIAAGPSMNFIMPSFFENKITLGINRVCIKFDCDYLVSKDGRGFSSIASQITADTKIILSKHESGNLHQEVNEFKGEHWIFEHPPKPNENPELSCLKRESEKIVVSYSTITSGIHLAAFMGAKNIMICGHDCGTIDGQSTILKYYENVKPHHDTNAAYISWLSLIEGHTALVAQTLAHTYGCNIHSLNPFINLNIEGHSYIPSNRGRILQRSFSTDEERRPTIEHNKNVSTGETK